MRVPSQYDLNNVKETLNPSTNKQKKASFKPLAQISSALGLISF